MLTAFSQPRKLSAYRQVLALVKVMAEAAAFLDPTRQELMFFKDGKFPVPIRYDAASLEALSAAAADRLLATFADDGHREQKLSILADVVTGIAGMQPASQRFRFILANLEVVCDRIKDGYRLLASEFSYSKIRRDVETAQFDYLSKIHKTFIDIQEQLLGIPVATIIVALVNQWLTLTAISGEVQHQRAKLRRDYATIGDQFADVFEGLTKRVRWHRAGLIVVGTISLAGSGFASFAFAKLVDVGHWTCITSRSSRSQRQREGLKPLPIIRVTPFDQRS